jgi:hypothetical protein
VAEVGHNLLGGVLAAVAFAAATAVWHFVRRPLYIPFDDSNWSNAVHVMLRDTGYDPTRGQQGWVINYEVEDYRVQGRIVVHVGRDSCKREVRATRKVGYAVLMS